MNSLNGHPALLVDEVIDFDQFGRQQTSLEKLQHHFQQIFPALNVSNYLRSKFNSCSKVQSFEDESIENKIISFLTNHISLSLILYVSNNLIQRSISEQFVFYIFKRKQLSCLSQNVSVSMCQLEQRLGCELRLFVFAECKSDCLRSVTVCKRLVHGSLSLHFQGLFRISSKSKSILTNSDENRTLAQ